MYQQFNNEVQDGHEPGTELETSHPLARVFPSPVAGTAKATSSAAMPGGGSGTRPRANSFPWHFPTPDECATLPEAQGFQVPVAQFHPRPTPLDGGNDLRLRVMSRVQESM